MEVSKPMGELWEGLKPLILAAANGTNCDDQAVSEVVTIFHGIISFYCLVSNVGLDIVIVVLSSLH